MVLLLDEGTIEVTGTVATVTPDPRAGGWMLGVDFEPLAPATAGAIVAWCFRHPFGAENPPTADRGTVTAPAGADRETVSFSGLLAAAEMAAATEAEDGPAPEQAPAP